MDGSGGAWPSRGRIEGKPGNLLCEPWRLRTFIEKEMPAAKNPGAFVDEKGDIWASMRGLPFIHQANVGVSASPPAQRLYVQQVQPVDQYRRARPRRGPASVPV